MKTKNIALTVYLVACLACVLAGYTNNESLLLLAKPTVIPAIYFYYLSSKKSKASWFVLLYFVASFIGDTAALLDFDDLFNMMVPFFISTAVLLGFAVMEVKKLKFDRNSLYIGLFIFIFLSAMMIMMFPFFPMSKEDLIMPVTFYGAQLFMFAALASYIFTSKASNRALYLVMAALFCVVSDFFHVMLTVLVLFPEFFFFDIGLQLFSYFFITKYFILIKN